MIDYIKAAIEMADGFSVMTPFDDGVEYLMHESHGTSKATPEQWFLDALAAQLVRQVDALDRFSIIIYEEETLIGDVMRIENIARGYSPDDRTMNTITAIVDSGVLK